MATNFLPGFVPPGRTPRRGTPNGAGAAIKFPKTIAGDILAALPQPNVGMGFGAAATDPITPGTIPAPTTPTTPTTPAATTPTTPTTPAPTPLRFTRDDIAFIANLMGNPLFARGLRRPGAENFLDRWAALAGLDPLGETISIDDLRAIIEGRGIREQRGQPGTPREREDFFNDLIDWLGRIQNQPAATPADGTPATGQPPFGDAERAAVRTPRSPETQLFLDMVLGAAGLAPTTAAGASPIATQLFREATGQGTTLPGTDALNLLAQGELPPALRERLIAQTLEPFGFAGARFGTDAARGVGTALSEASANAILSAAQQQTQRQQAQAEQRQRAQSQIIQMLMGGAGLTQDIEEQAQQRLLSEWASSQGLSPEIQALIAAMQVGAPGGGTTTISNPSAGLTAAGSGVGGLANMIMLWNLMSGSGAQQAQSARLSGQGFTPQEIIRLQQGLPR